MARNKVIPAGNVLEAKFAAGTPTFIKPIKHTGSRKLGLQYEEKAHDYIERAASKHENYGLKFASKKSPWLVYNSQGDAPDQVRYCQPDHLFIDDWQKKVTILEVKLQHCIEAFDQLRYLYEPVVKKIFPDYDIALCEVVQWYDPHIRFPETFYFEESLTQCEIGKIAIHIYNPRYDPLAKRGRSKTNKTTASTTQL